MTALLAILGTFAYFVVGWFVVKYSILFLDGVEETTVEGGPELLLFTLSILMWPLVGFLVAGYWTEDYMKTHGSRIRITLRKRKKKQ